MTEDQEFLPERVNDLCGEQPVINHDATAALAPEEGYLLVKRGLYYRPNAMGYTGLKVNAGRYTREQAKGHEDPISGVSVVHQDIAPLIAPKCFDDIARDYLLHRLTIVEEALKQIATIEPRPSSHALDWRAIDTCEDCQRYKDHPIQRGICDTHRRPIWDREKHDAHEEKALGYRAKSIARDALYEAERNYSGASQ